MDTSLRSALGVGTLLLLMLATGFGAFTLSGTVLSSVLVLIAGFAVFTYALKSDSAVAFLLPMCAGIGNAAAMLAVAKGAAPLFIFMTVISAIIGVVCLVVGVILTLGMLFRSKSLYKDGTLDAELIALGSLLPKIGNTMADFAKGLRNGYVRKTAGADTSEIAALRSELAAANARIMALEKSSCVDALQTLADLGQMVELHGRIAALEETASSAQKAKLASLKAKRDKNPLVKD